MCRRRRKVDPAVQLEFEELQQDMRNAALMDSPPFIVRASDPPILECAE